MGNPTLRELEQSLPLALLKAREATMVRFRPMLKKHGLTEQQWRVIRVLAADQPLDASALAERTFLLAPSVSRILTTLQDRGLIERSADRSDQRRSVLRLSATGEQRFRDVAPDSEALYAQIEVQIGSDDMARLYELLARFTSVLEDSEVA